MNYSRRLIGRAIFTALIVLFSPHLASADQVIHAYTTHIELQEDGSASVQEEIVYDFGGEIHHGIYRTIPLAVKVIGKADFNSLNISNILVTDSQGNRIRTTHDSGGNTITLTIGDPNIEISGQQLYVIRYTIHGATSPNLITDQFDWDVTGSSWQVPIERARAEIVIPTSISPSKVTFRCELILDNRQTGECQDKEIIFSTSTNKQTIRFETRNISQHSQFVIQTVFPKGSILYKGDLNQPTVSTNINGSYGIVRWWNRPFINYSLVIPFIIFFILLSFYVNRNNSRVYTGINIEQSFSLVGLALVVLSFFVKELNLASILTGFIFIIFAILFRK